MTVEGTCRSSTTINKSPPRKQRSNVSNDGSSNGRKSRNKSVRGSKSLSPKRSTSGGGLDSHQVIDMLEQMAVADDTKADAYFQLLKNSDGRPSSRRTSRSPKRSNTKTPLAA
ncbi:expressed unknown protein [Seminavis robusta]|uniref:Uncharacterized protein n=1 Tax=Seminavis robusta TaxID=568900 RepID=A0A9N8DUH8_9STRA|nr:expressed unknown protein [Seminavis robusta]|eukprot:Sro290_g109260.1 n/a (113) ;mRNA; r:16883-17221